jgi:phosphate transport system permease protein
MNARVTDRIASVVIWALSIGIVALLGWFILYLLYKGLKYIDWHFITAPPSITAGGGVGPQLFNSFYLLLVTMIIALPIGVGAGIYMSEFAPVNRFTEAIRLATETLASLPSIVIGLFGLLLFVNRFQFGFSVISGALALTVLNLPVMERVTETTIRAVPPALREGSLALGMTRWQTIRTVLLPAALPGLVTGFILVAGRIFGEAAALLYTAGQSSAPLNWSNWNLFGDSGAISLFRPAETLAVHIWKLNSEAVVPDYRQIADGASALLVICVLIFNVLSRFVGRALYRRITATR